MRFGVLLCWLLVAIGQPAVATASPVLESLQQRLASLAASRPGEFGIAAIDLGSGAVVSYNGGQPFPMASTVKVAVAAAYLQQVDHGRRSLHDTIGKQTASKLIEAMLIRSDNAATDVLIRNLGGPQAIDHWVRWHGLSGIRVDRTIAQLLADKRDLWDVRDSSTPVAMVQLLRKLDTGNILRPASRAYLLDTMARCMTGSNRIRGLLPAGTPVANKTGTLNGLTDDVGYITLPNGRRIAVALFARGGSDRPRTIAEAARTIYDMFSLESIGSYAAAFSTTVVPNQAAYSETVAAQTARQ